MNRGLPVLDQPRSPEVVILGAGQKERGLWDKDDYGVLTKKNSDKIESCLKFEAD